MLTFGQSYHKETDRIYDPIARRWSIVDLPFFSAEQFADLGESLQALLGDAFVSWVATEHPFGTDTQLEYNGLIEDDVELDRNVEIQAAYQAWEASY